MVQVHTACSDFLTISSHDETYEQVTDILLDPSCSGSGIFSRQPQSSHSSQKTPADRLMALAQFQKSALVHALTKFQNVQRVVYSTCSLHEEENEQVVAHVLSECGDRWRLVAPTCLQDWKRRGLVTAGLTPVQAAALIRVDHPDQTNGFFVACWERIGNAASKDEPVPTRPSVPEKKLKQTPRRTLDTKKQETGELEIQSNAHAGNQKAGKANQLPSKKHTDPSDKTMNNLKREPAWVKHSGKKKRKRR